MLPKTRRVSKVTFTEALAKSRSYHGTYLTIRVNFTKIIENTTESRFSVVIAKSVYKKAVDRNKLRRGIYNFLYPIKTIKPATVLIFVKKEAKTILLKVIKEELKELLKKANLI
jgi:ribonuclease P protein component